MVNNMDVPWENKEYDMIASVQHFLFSETTKKRVIDFVAINEDLEDVDLKDSTTSVPYSTLIQILDT